MVPDAPKQRQLLGLSSAMVGYPILCKAMSVLAQEERGEDLPPAMSRGFVAIADSVPVARRAVVAVAEAAGAEEQQIEAVALASSEALTNAVRHAYAGRPGQIHVSAWTADEALVVVIADNGSGLQAQSEAAGLGAGLGLIARLSDEFEVVQPASGGTEVQMRFWLGADGRA
jgi:anti-sigma regulatory factor (Ser/Thr protein kinase)